MMPIHPLVQAFTDAADIWLCDSFSLVIRYLGLAHSGHVKIIDAQLTFQPLRTSNAIDFSVRAGELIAGQKSFPVLRKTELQRRLADAIGGKIQLGKQLLELESEATPRIHSEMPVRDRWEFDLHLQVWGTQLQHPPAEQLLREDHLLRTSKLPFDGVTDLANWLTLVDRRTGTQASSISIRVARPVDVVLLSTTLRNDVLAATLVAHARLDTSRVVLAARAAPGIGMKARMQLASQIQWMRPSKGLRSGYVEISTPNAESVLLVLSFGPYTVRRHWFEDPTKASNSRWVTLQAFDRDLKQLKMSLLEPTDSRRFEKAVTAVLFLLGFSPAQQIETEAPDIVAMTPSGAIAVVECTIKTSDVRVKVAKLVERRGALTAALQASRHARRVDAFLVCALPKEQIASETNFLVEQKVLVLTRENIVQALGQVRFPSNSDKLLEQADQALTAQARPLQ